MATARREVFVQVPVSLPAVAPPSQARHAFLAATADRLPEHDPEMVYLLAIARRMGHIVSGFQQRVLRDHDLDNATFAVLRALWYMPPPHRLSQAEICTYVVLTPSGVTRALHRLQDRNMVKRIGDIRDGRLAHVKLTAKGLRVAREALADATQQFQEALGWPAPDRVRRLSELQAEIADLLEPLLHGGMGSGIVWSDSSGAFS
jgi:DNA-binding MarR family transcriptional regulator